MDTPHPRSVWLVRHGQADWNLARRYLSDTDRPLTSYGQRQTAALARFFQRRRIDVVIHTGLLRTQLAASAIAMDRGILMVCDPRWRETSHGSWEGLTYREVLRRFPDNAQSRFANPLTIAPVGGESLQQMADRVFAAWTLLGTQYPNQRIVVITHATPIQATLCRLTQVPLAEHWRWRMDSGSATGLDCYPGTTIIRAVNVIPHIG